MTVKWSSEFIGQHNVNHARSHKLPTALFLFTILHRTPSVALLEDNQEFQTDSAA